MRDDVILALTAAGYGTVDVRTTLTPAWTTDWMTDAGKRKLTEYGIAPPLRSRTPVAGSDPGAPRRQVPAVRLTGHPRGRAVRLDIVQGALRVPCLPGAVRPFKVL